MTMVLDQTDISVGITLQLINYVLIATVCVWLYDYALTFDEEVDFILHIRWGIPTLSYLVCRYLSFVMVIISALRILNLQPMLSIELCSAYFVLCGYIGAVVVFCAELLFIQRVWVVSGGSCWRSVILFCNVVLFATPVAVTLAMFESSSTVLLSPIEQITSCYINKIGNTVVYAYILLIAEETEIMGLMLFYSWKHYRESRHVTPLVRILVKHNFFYYVCGLFLSTLTVVMIYAAPAPYYGIVADLQVVMHAILVTHMHRELWRAANNNDEATSLDTLPVVVFAFPSSSRSTHD